ncbi:hypothetical protein B0H34DRAFT_696688 [Crassisporium funariophilum]|nr:hypothetical protein B0H34DRAFT_696688 [Crassisporium funariophilum]
MPLVASGFIRQIGSAGGSKFAATFTIDGLQYTLAGTFVARAPRFNCHSAKLTYSSMGQLSSTRLIEGTLGPKKLTLRLPNGPVIEGLLESGSDHIYKAYDVVGCGIWFHN